MALEAQQSPFILRPPKYAWLETMNTFPEKLTKKRLKESEKKKILDWSLYPHLYQNVMGSITGQDPTSIQVSWKSAQQFLCYHLDKPTNQWTQLKA